MNKYQEALNTYCCLESTTTVDEHTPLEYTFARLKLQELVERATPKKPHRLLHEKMSGLNWYHCPICNKHVGSVEKGRYTYKLDYCSKCGQRILWGEDDE